MTKGSLADLLLEKQVISSHDLIDFEDHKQRNPDMTIEDFLLIKNRISEIDLVKAKAIFYEIPWVNLQEIEINPRLLEMIPEKLARRHLLLPLEIREDGIHIAIVNPKNILALDEVQMLTGKMVTPHLSLPSQTLNAIDHLYPLGHQSTSQMIQMIDEGKQPKEETENDLIEQKRAPLIRLVNQLIYYAIQNRASDIHIEPAQDHIQVRFRIDGVLTLFNETFPRRIHPPLISRLKIMANLDISQRFIPQDGSITYNYNGNQIDLRVSIMPTIRGEKAVIRILNQNAQIIPLEKTGLLPEDLTIFKGLLHKKNGMILITGPTGSGKSTTLSSSINFLRSPSINISTVEDPVEYKIVDTNQIQVNEKTGLTFARALRSLLRQDPDVLMIGEIRDEETARIAIKAAQTGHLVLSSLHTNDTLSSITRLRDMGIAEYLISSSLMGVVAQRLVRRICPECKRKIKPGEVNRLSLPQNFQPITLFQGVGCDKCNDTGYHDRIGIFEILPIDNHVRSQLARLLAKDQHDFSDGLDRKTLLEDALIKVNRGLTTLQEIQRVIL